MLPTSDSPLDCMPSMKMRCSVSYLLIYRLHAVQVIPLEMDMQKSINNHAVKELYDTTLYITQNFQKVLHDKEISFLAVNQ